ncbi:hypothetical protein PR048_014870 [Dryococelus australis]|uniref:Uncharacterized protein n=1 Tax=Dryococelus australis TaxID=614101 RepID=A0ABQ9HFD9_9NEOP|nr:hypothetical protein PR048_014870 [Dryococelus australis]
MPTITAVGSACANKSMASQLTAALDGQRTVHDLQYSDDPAIKCDRHDAPKPAVTCCYVLVLSWRVSALRLIAPFDDCTATVAERLTRSLPTKVNRALSPAGSPNFQVGIVPNNVVGWRVFSGISRFPRPFIPANVEITREMGAAARALASQFPAEPLPDPRKRCRWPSVFLGDLPFPSVPTFQCCSIHCFALNGSQYLIVKSRPNLSTHSRVSHGNPRSSIPLEKRIVKSSVLLYGVARTRAHTHTHTPCRMRDMCAHRRTTCAEEVPRRNRVMCAGVFSLDSHSGGPRFGSGITLRTPLNCRSSSGTKGTPHAIISEPCLQMRWDDGYASQCRPYRSLTFVPPQADAVEAAERIFRAVTGTVGTASGGGLAHRRKAPQGCVCVWRAACPWSATEASVLRNADPKPTCFASGHERRQAATPRRDDRSAWGLLASPCLSPDCSIRPWLPGRLPSLAFCRSITYRFYTYRMLTINISAFEASKRVNCKVNSHTKPLATSPLHAIGMLISVTDCLLFLGPTLQNTAKSETSHRRSYTAGRNDLPQVPAQRRTRFRIRGRLRARQGQREKQT